MTILMIAYDLSSGSMVEKALSSAVRSLGRRWARPLAALWYIETAAPIAEIENFLSSLIGDEDGLLIQEVAGQMALANTMLRWTCGSVLTPVPTNADGQHRSWQPLLIAGGFVPTGGRLPISKSEVAAAA
jgi:hypothetical protein